MQILNDPTLKFVPIQNKDLQGTCICLPFIPVIPRIAAVILKGAAKFGVSESRLIRETRFDPNLLHDPDARITLEQENALWLTAADLAEDAAFGLHVAEMIQPGMFDVLDYVVRTAPTLRAAVDRLARYNRLMHDIAEFRVEDLPEGVLIDHRFRTPDLKPIRHAAEFTMASLIVIARQVAGRLPLVVSVSFAHPAPEDMAEHRRIFGVLPAFAAPWNTLLLTADSMLAQVPAADPALSRIVTSHADQLLRKLSISVEDCLISRVRQVILAGLAEGKATIGEAARQLCMSERSLQHPRASSCHRRDYCERDRPQRCLLALGRCAADLQAVQDLLADGGYVSRPFAL